MNSLENKINNIIKQVNLLKDIKEGDKIYIYDNIMYFHTPSAYQTIYRTLTGESREHTFKYLENFIATFIHNYVFIKTNKLYLEKLHTNLKDKIPIIKNILNILKKTYPDNHKEINNLSIFLLNSI